MTTTVELAQIEDIRTLAERIPDNWALCELFAHKRRATEAEFMVAQTLHACRLNAKEYSVAFSWKGDGVESRGGGGLVDNATAYGYLLSDGYFVEDERDGKTIIYMTQKLVDLIKRHLAKQSP
ncbi:hypothetical protein LCGC14_2108840 [marine sediment metagenome]|uniref:Uncharacterized protein n=1 Tax=marine sediment metagenome TaxID=412755 RepID=A0A0F9E7S2_9ZZZZ